MGLISQSEDGIRILRRPNASDRAIAATAHPR
jgi:hypothetical protein